jgi:hypothetical protein
MPCLHWQSLIIPRTRLTPDRTPVAGGVKIPP